MGLDSAGKTTLLYKMSRNVDTTIPTIGFNVEKATLKFDNMELISVDAWDVGGRDKIRPLWRHFYKDKDAVIFVVDSNDRERLGEAADQLLSMSQEELLAGKPILIFANKQDHPHAAKASELVEKLELHRLRHAKWHLQESAFLEGKGITEGLQWLMATLHGAPISSGLPKTKESPKDLDEVSTSAGSDVSTL